MNKQWIMVGAVSLALMAMNTSSALAKEDKEEKEVKMSFKEVPAEVRATLKREAFGAKIKTVDKEEIDGKTVYEADVKIDGVNYEILVGEDGKLISKSIDEEENADKSDAKSEKKTGKGDSEEKDSKRSVKNKEDKEDEKDDDEKPSKKLK